MVVTEIITRELKRLAWYVLPIFAFLLFVFLLVSVLVFSGGGDAQADHTLIEVGAPSD